ncbi:MAG: hypothetical protein N4A49_11150 [Marinifilaceae bacterium]|jgi:hypothetical protein|nr:hypothetical protein [Marinifilaceae bacterium]
MKRNILDEFGRLMIKEVFDNQYKFILNSVIDLSNTQGYENLFKNMSCVQKKEMENYTKEILKGVLFDFLRIFEENEQFKLVYDDGEKQINLNEISEMLKAEPIIENGWIERFSKEIKKDQL